MVSLSSSIIPKKDKIAILPAALLNNIRSAAAVKFYDYLLEDNSTTIQLQEKTVFNYYHGNIEQNNISQVDLLLNGYGDYCQLFDEEVNSITDRDTCSDITSIRQLVLKDTFTDNPQVRWTAKAQI